MVKKPRDSVALYPRRLEVRNVDRLRMEKVIEALKGSSSVQEHSPSLSTRIRAKRAAAAAGRAVRGRIVDRSDH
jgi:hypothetical protein